MKQTQKTICVLNPDDKYYIEHNKREDVRVKDWIDNIVTPTEIAGLRKEGYTFPDVNIENRVYCLDPLRPKHYISRTQETDEKAIETRIKTLEQILQLLGGKNFRVTRELSYRAERYQNAKVDVAASYEIYDVDTNIESLKSTDDNATAKGEGYSEWKGEYSISDYYRAVKIAQEIGLDQDPVVKSFIEKREPHILNEIQKETYRYSACSDLKENRDLCVKIKGGVQDLLSINVSVDTACNSSVENDEIFEYEVEFGKFISPKKKWLIPIIAALLIAGGIAIGIFVF